MSKHYNLCYLLEEDQKNNQMSEEAKNRIRNNLESFYLEKKPPWRGREINPPKDYNGRKEHKIYFKNIKPK